MKHVPLSGFLIGLVALATFTSAAQAEPFVQNQQAEMKKWQQVWDEKNIPAGMQNSELRPAGIRDSGADAVSLYVKEVNFSVVENIGFYVHQLAATLVPNDPSVPVAFDDVESFRIQIHHGKVTVRPEALTALFNKHILDYSPRPLNNMRVTTEKDTLIAKGGLRLWNWFPGFWLPAKLSGGMILKDNNTLSYEPDDIRGLGIPLAGLLKLLHIKLPWLLTLERTGAVLEDFNLALDHREVFPPPAIAGDIENVWLDEEGLHLTFSDNPAAKFKEPPIGRDSYIWIQSGDARLYGIVVVNTQALVVADSDDLPLYFNLYDYRRQVAGGIIKLTADGTIIATLPTSEPPKDDDS